MKVRHYKPKDKLVSEQYVIDENGFITIPSTTLFTAGLSSDKEFVVLEKYNADNVYYIVPSNFEYNEKEYGFLFNPEVENGDLKFSVKGLFEHLKPGDSITLDVYEFQLLLYDRSNVVIKEDEEETGLDAGKINWTEGLDEFEKKFLTKKDWNDEINKLESELNEKERELLKEEKKKRRKKSSNKESLDNVKEWMPEPNLETLDNLFGKILTELMSNSMKRLHPSKDELLNEFINDMLARVYGRDGQKIVMINSDELEQFVQDMTWWYNRIKSGK